MTANSRADGARQFADAARRERLAFDILARDEHAPIEIALFLAQQALEMALKAVLASRSAVYRRTHDRLLLEALANDAGLTVPVAHALLARLGPCAVEFRYPGVAAPLVTLGDARVASIITG